MHTRGRIISKLVGFGNSAGIPQKNLESSALIVCKSSDNRSLGIAQLKDGFNSLTSAKHWWEMPSWNGLYGFEVVLLTVLTVWWLTYKGLPEYWSFVTTPYMHFIVTHKSSLSSEKQTTSWNFFICYISKVDVRCEHDPGVLMKRLNSVEHHLEIGIKRTENKKKYTWRRSFGVRSLHVAGKS